MSSITESINKSDSGILQVLITDVYIPGAKSVRHRHTATHATEAAAAYNSSKYYTENAPYLCYLACKADLKALARHFCCTGLTASVRMAPPAPKEAACRASPESCPNCPHWFTAAAGATMLWAVDSIATTSGSRLAGYLTPAGSSAQYWLHI